LGISFRGFNFTKRRNMKVRIKKIVSSAVVPQYAKAGDAGLDLVATSKGEDEFGNMVYGTGLSIEIPRGYAGFLFPRSSISKYGLVLSNSIGLIDSGYRGELIVKFKPTPHYSGRKPEFPFEYEVGEKVAQLVLMPVPIIELEELLEGELSATDRGTGGFGSTDTPNTGDSCGVHRY
jgi:dUTP pyrophosphatase